MLFAFQEPDNTRSFDSCEAQNFSVMEEKGENVKVSLYWSIIGLQKLLCCLSLSLKAENETRGAKAVFHLQGVLRRWLRFCETA